MSRLRKRVERIEQRAAAASAGHRPVLRVDQPAAAAVPRSNVLAATPTPAKAPAAAAASSQSTAVTRIVEPVSAESFAQGQPAAPIPVPAPTAHFPPAAPAAEPAFAQRSFAEVADSAAATRVDTPRIDPPQRADQNHAPGRTVHAQHEQRRPHLPPANWQSATKSPTSNNEKYSEPAGFDVSARDASSETPSGTATAAIAKAVPAPVQANPAPAAEPPSPEPPSAEPSSAEPAAHRLSAVDLIIPAAPPEEAREPSEVSIHPPSPVAAPHIPASRFVAAAAADPGRSVTKPFQQTCRKILAALPGGGISALLFASVDAPYNSASTVANLAVAMTDQIDAPVLAIDASRDAVLTKELRVNSTNALIRILRGTTSWEDCIVQTSVPGLCLLPSTSGHDRVAPFAFQRLLTELKSQFGLLLIDVGTFDETTALSLAGLCTATYLTLRQGHTTKDRARAAQRQLKSNGASLAGCVLISAET